MSSDIEHQLPRQEIEEEEENGRTHIPPDDGARPAASQSSWVSSLFRIILKALIILFFALFLAYIVVVTTLLGPLLYTLIYSFPKTLRDKIGYHTSIGKSVGVYDQSRRGQGYFLRRILMGLGSILPRANLVLLVWLLLNLSVPRLRKLELAGSPLWKWSLLGATITYTNLQAVCLYTLPPFVVSAVQLELVNRYFYDGLKLSGTLVIQSLMVLVAWMLYFRTDSGLKHPSTPHPEAFDYMTLTFVSVFVGSILWLLKAFLLLKWSAGAIYRRFEPRILIAGVKFVYLGLLVDGIFQEDIVTELNLDEMLESASTIGAAKYIVSRKTEMSHLVYVGGILTSLAQIVSSQDNDGSSHVIQRFRQQSRKNTQDQDVINELLEQLDLTDYEKATPSTQVTIERVYRICTSSRSATDIMKGVRNLIIEYNDQEVQSEEGPVKTILADFLKELVREELIQSEEPNLDLPSEEESKKLPSKEITFDDLKKWMVDGHKECVNMGRTLADAKAIVTRLDIFLSFVILGAAILLWLLITGIATTKVLLTIATPLLTMTFIFGDTAKSFFQGLVFCFATHAFDVGDRCILDETELEVKSISILTTTFVKIGTKEKRLYPNSVLATKAIVNLGWQPDATDVVELTLDPSINIHFFEAQIVKFFGEHKAMYNEGSYEVTIKEVGDNAKVSISIHFTHILTVSDFTHSKCLRKKREQRTLFLKAIKQFLAGSPKKEADVTNER